MTVYHLTLQTNDTQAGIRQLRWLLKTLARQYGLKCTSVQEIKSPQTDPHKGAPPHGEIRGAYLPHREKP